MKKALVASVIITSIVSLDNLVTGYFGRAPIFSIHSTGGEYEYWFEFGLLKEKFYPLTTIDSIHQGHTEMHFSPISLFVCFILVLLVTFLVRKIIDKICKRRFY